MPNKRIKSIITFVIILSCILSLYSVWRYYIYSPWTRDARVRADIITIAPDVSGFVNKIYVSDNQKVKKGDLIFSIDDERYRAALNQRDALLKHSIIDWQLAHRQYLRRIKLGKNGSISPEELDDYHMQEKLKKADLEKAKADAKLAKINLDRTKIYAPESGIINNIDLRQGNYVTQSKPVMSLTKAGSFYITGYFEETKLPYIHIGDKVKIKLMNGDSLNGRVKSVGSGVADNNTDVNNQLLPKVQETYDWVRLAKRIPVDISIIKTPEHIKLVSGTNASVAIQ